MKLVLVAMPDNTETGDCWAGMPDGCLYAADTLSADAFLRVNRDDLEMTVRSLMNAMARAVHFKDNVHPNTYEREKERYELPAGHPLLVDADPMLLRRAAVAAE